MTAKNITPNLTSRLITAAATWWPAVQDRKTTESQLAMLTEVGTANGDTNALRVSEAASQLRLGKQPADLVEAIEQAAAEQRQTWTNAASFRASKLEAASAELAAAVASQERIDQLNAELKEAMTVRQDAFQAAVDAGVLKSELSRATGLAPSRTGQILGGTR